LKQQLPEECALFSSVGLTDRGEEREIDILVAWPGNGIAVIEVKGGTVSCEQRQWFQASGNDKPHKIQNPITQAQDAKHTLLRFLRGCSTVLPKVRAAHLVAFPYTSIGKDWLAPDCPRDMAIGRGELKSAAARVRQAIQAEGRGFQPLDMDGCVALETALEGTLPGQASLLTVAQEHEHRVDQMTRDQMKLLNMLRHHRRAVVIGGAGTGKTWMAAEQARRLTKSGERVALLCYSRGLARFLQRLADTWPAAEIPAFVGLFHHLPLEWGAPSGDDDDSDYWERRLPLALGELALTRPAADLYDSIIVDEAQDFGDLWWPPLLSCLRDSAQGGLFVFMDEAQRVFARQSELPIALAPFELDENIRNTKNVAQTFASLSGEKLQFRGLNGPPVRFVQCATDAALEAADDQVDKLLEDWEPGQMALLTTGKRHGEQVNEIELGGYQRYWDDFFEERDVFYGHVLGFKGLERQVVVLAVNGFRDLERAKEMLYVGLSRARTQLVVCGDLDVIASIGGDAVRHRLRRAEQG
jgi:hypothetical protein